MCNIGGLIKAYLDDHDALELETDNVAGKWKWPNSLTRGVVPEHDYMVQQLNQRKADQYLTWEVRTIDMDSNALAMYLSSHGADNYRRTVIIEHPLKGFSKFGATIWV